MLDMQTAPSVFSKGRYPEDDFEARAGIRGYWYGCIFHRGRRQSLELCISDRGIVVRIECRIPVLACSAGNRVRLRLHRVSISARNDRSNHSLNEVRSASEPYAYSNFDRTLADAVESAATICALMYRETSPRRRHGDVTGTVRLSTNQILRYTGCRAQFFT